LRMALTAEEQKAFFLLMGISGAGVNLTDEDSLKKAFRSKAKKSHPDLAVRLGKDPGLMQIRFQELNEAFNLLMERLQKEQKGHYTYQPGPHNSPVREQKKAGQAYTGSSSARDYRRSQSRTRTDFRQEAPRAENPATPDKDPGDFYFNGRTPEKNLRFAEYLYYSGAISWTDLVQALVWQYRHRPKIGEMATASGLLEFEEVLEIIKEKKTGELFGETAVRLGFLDRDNLTALIRKQKQMDLPIGKFFLDSKKMSRETLHKKLSENRRHNLIYDDDRSDS